MTYKRVRRARGTTAVVDAYVGPVGELVIDTDLLEIRLQNGVAGGLRVPRFGGPAVFSTLQTTGNTTLGDAAGDTVTINGTAVSIPNSLNFDSDTLFIDSTNNRVGIGTATTLTGVDKLAVVGGNIAVQRTSGITTIFGDNTQRGYVGTTTDHTFSVLVNGIETAMFDPAGNAGLGVPPSPQGLGVAFDIGSETSISNVASSTRLTQNGYVGGAGNVDRYKTSSFASLYQLASNGNHIWFNAPSGIAGNPITFTQAMTLTQGGNLLVGTTIDAGSKLSIVGGVLPTNLGLHQSYAVPSGNGRLVSGATNLGIVNNYLDDSTIEISAGTTSGLNLVSGIVVTAGSATNPNLIRFFTSNTEAARITSARYFKASNTGMYGGVAGVVDLSAASLHVFQNDANNTGVLSINGNTSSGVVNFDSALATGAAGLHYSALVNGSRVYQVLANGNVQNTNNSYGAISDAKLKENVTDVESYLDRFMQVRFRNFNFIGSDLKQFGVIAQELETVFPGLVDETPDTVEVTKTRIVEVPAVLDEEGNEVTPATTREEEYTAREPNGEVTKSVKYSILAQIQGKVIQEQQAIIQSQQAQIDAILERLTSLEAK